MIFKLKTKYEILLCEIQVIKSILEEYPTIISKIYLEHYSFYLLDHNSDSSKIIAIFNGINSLSEILKFDSDKSDISEEEVSKEVHNFLVSVSEDLDLKYSVDEHLIETSTF